MLLKMILLKLDGNISTIFKKVSTTGRFRCPYSKDRENCNDWCSLFEFKQIPDFIEIFPAKEPDEYANRFPNHKEPSMPICYVVRHCGCCASYNRVLPWE